MDETFSYCSLPPVPPREFAAGTDPARVEAIVVNESKWVNHTVLHYYFFDRDTDGEHVFGSDGTRHWRPWTTDKAHQDVVRGAFDHWKAQDIGLEFVEVSSRDEEKVYAELGGPPNNWPREKTRWNILRKIEPDTVQGSNWDPHSIMHYPFQAGLILEPERYRTQPLRPAGGLSARDLAWVRAFYPGEDDTELPELLPFQSRELAILPGAQRDFVIRPTATRQYTLQPSGSPTSSWCCSSGPTGSCATRRRRRQRRGPQRHPPDQALPGPRRRPPGPALLQPGLGRDRRHAVVRGSPSGGPLR
jgi:hypothetical protein